MDNLHGEKPEVDEKRHSVRSKKIRKKKYKFKKKH